MYNLLLTRYLHQFPHPLLQELLDGFQPLGRQIVVLMPGEGEADHFAQLFLLAGGDELPDHVFKGNAGGGQAGFGVGGQVVKIIGHAVVEQGQAIIEDRGQRIGPVGVVIHHHAEIAEVTILVIDDRIEDEHIHKLVIDPGIKRTQIFCHRAQGGVLHQPVDGYKGMVDIAEKLADGADSFLPFAQVVVHMAKTHTLCDLGGVVFAVGLVAGIGCAAGAALEQVDAPIQPAPALAQHTGGGKLRRGGKALDPGAAVAGIGDQRQHFDKIVLIKVEIGKGAGKVILHHPVAVIEGQPPADAQDAPGIAVGQPVLCQQRIHILPVFGNDAPAQPVHQPGIIQPQPKGHPAELLLIDPGDAALLTVDGVVCNGKPHQRCIVLLEAEHMRGSFLMGWQQGWG